jgi:hypothetical protein
MATDIRSLSQVEIDKEISALLAKYSSVGWPFKTREVLSECIASLGGLFPAQTSLNHEPRRFYFFRVRTASSFKSEDETKIPEQYGLPPLEYCTSVGRAHIPGHPVFYASDSYEAAVREMKLPNEQYYFISCWYTDEISIEKLNFLFANNICSTRLLDNFNQVVTDMWEQHNVLDDSNRDRMKAHLCAWSNLFLSDNYSLTASIAHTNMFGEYASHKMICYGSALDGKATNYAVHPELASQFKLHRVYSVSVPDIHGKIGFIQCAKTGDNGMLEWKQITDDELPPNDPFLPTKFEGAKNI